MDGREEKVVEQRYIYIKKKLFSTEAPSLGKGRRKHTHAAIHLRTHRHTHTHGASSDRSRLILHQGGSREEETVEEMISVDRVMQRLFT